MKVWVVEGGWDYEGFLILGAYSTKEGAEDKVRLVEASHSKVRYDFTEIEEVEVDE